MGRGGGKGFTELVAVFGKEVEGGLHEGLFLQPVGIGVGFPFAEVLFVDGPAAKFVGEDGLDFGEAVEPGDEAVAGDAIADGAGELAADVAGQAPDFTSV